MGTSRDPDLSSSVIDKASTAAISAALPRHGVDSLGERARAAAVFGEPVTAGGITVIPVAQARFGFGRTGSSDGAEGGGADVRPLGYIEIRDGTARYRPIGNQWSRAVAPLIALASGLSVAGIIRAVRRSPTHNSKHTV
ncbi:GerW family sporulation protein [Nocardia sp. NPDC052278]|uniref:GerW family sporulation protein n=1 Tax=unclassified Nocardia TaxID=2637762 RepID=UPI0036A8424A